MNNILLTILIALTTSLLLQSCGSSTKVITESRTLDTLVVFPEKPKSYQASATKKFDLIHTELHVAFNWEKQQLNGEAVLTLRPHFYTTNIIELDAKGFEIHKVGVKIYNDIKPLPFKYDSLVLSVNLFEPLTNLDTFQLFISYTAKPNNLTQKGSAAITDAKGLYFINPLGEEENKPQQIWTQGETESNSCWFPTIDHPNQKMTQEIYITADEKHKTLSNGELVHQTENGNGTRTDYWKQDKPHAPYLAMMAIGDFALVEDNWRDSVPVNYYVEHDYEQYAKAIFGLTPDMMEFFSQKMGVDYPWAKYSQVVVRDYVSGAMENTSATIHGEFLHQTAREMIDGDNQDIISHELFHHWFGDLVTCESWSNLPLNESFATYGEYLWREFKSGREFADEHLERDLYSYLRESKYKQADMIRFDYDDKEDMFDSHSYAKGGRILHMLRYYVGDAAFFESLRVYLTENAFQTVEIHDLRLAFEKVTGEDLNWFFNQWFLSSGHPKLSFKTSYNDSLKEVIINTAQLQDLLTTPLYRLPINIDFYTSTGLKREKIIVSEKEQEFRFNYSTAPKLINIDADKMLLCEKEESKPLEEWIYQYNSTPLYIDKKEALTGIKPYIADNERAFETYLSSLNDKNDKTRALTIIGLEAVAESKRDEVEALLIKVAKEDESSKVRGAAIAQLGEFYNDSTHSKIFVEALKDSSYYVMKEALKALSKVNSEMAMNLSKTYENEQNKNIQLAVADVYASYGDATVHDYFIKMSTKISGYAKYSFIPAYIDYLSRNASPDVITKALPALGKFNGGDAFMQFYGYTLMDLSDAIKAEQMALDEKIKKVSNPIAVEKLMTEKKEFGEVKEKVDALIKSLKK